MMLDQLKIDVELVKKDVGEIKSDMREMKDDFKAELKNIFYLLNGNGKKGIVERLTALEFRVWVMWGVAAIAITLAGHLAVRYIGK